MNITFLCLLAAAIIMAHWMLDEFCGAIDTNRRVNDLYDRKQDND